MTIYKIASQTNFANEAGLKTRLTPMKDREFAAYLGVLSQVHESLRQQVDLETAVVEAAGTAYAAKIKAIIQDIGEKTFISSEFDQISKSLEELRKPTPPASTVPGPLPGIVPEPVAPGKELLTIDQLLAMDTNDRVSYFENLDYPKSVQQKAYHILENLKIIDLAYSDEDMPENAREESKRDLVDAMITLLKMAEGTEEEEPQPLEEDEETEEVSKDEATGKGTGTKTKRQHREKQVSNASTSATISKDDVLEQEIFKNPSFKEFQAKSNNPYIDFTTLPPTVNQDLELVFGNFFSQIEAIFNQAWKIGKNTIPPELRQKFNTLVYSVKTADTMAYDEFQEAMKKAPEEYAKDFKNLEHRLLNELPTQVILKEGGDFSSFNTFFFTALLLSAPKLGSLLVGGKNTVLEEEMEKNRHIQESELDDIRVGIDNLARAYFKSKAEDFFRLTSHYKEKNFLDRTSLKWDYMLKTVLAKVYPSGPGYTLKPCPTCYKWVPWTASRAAKKRNPNLQGFRVRLVSFLTDNRDHPKITLEDLQSRKWPALPSSLYSEDREKQLAIEYARAGEKSWDEIQALLNSNDPSKHEEGWHRRSGALYAAGGVFLTNHDVLIKYLFNECPFGETQTQSLCGISFAPTKTSPLMSGGLALQPVWNGLQDSSKDPYRNTVNLVEDLWEDKEMFQKAKQLQRGGFKFSKINFACTCRIAQPDSKSSYKHSNVAISKVGVAGTKGFVYPTKPNGAPDHTLEDGTLTYMVCGAPTSLSSFDRNPESAGFILKYLKEVRDVSAEDYRILISYLVREGVDVQDVMDLDQDLDKFVAAGLEKESSTMQHRMKKLAFLIKEAMIYMSKEGFGSEKRKYFGGLTLVCPFGHHFTIDHSLNFAEANAGIFQKINILKDFAPIITTQGEANLKALIKEKYLIEANHPDMSEFPNKMLYAEWSQHNDGMVFPDSETRDKPLLMFPIPVNFNGDIVNFVFREKKKGWKKNIWNPDESYESPRYEDHNLQLDESERSALSSIVGGEEASTDLFDSAGYNEWKLDKDNPVVDYDYNRIPGSPIPGSGNLEDDTGINLEEFDRKIMAFSRAIKSTLRIIITWTKGLVSNQMMAAMLTDYHVDVSPYVNEISAPLLPYLVLEDLAGEKLNLNSSDNEVGLLIQDVKQYIVNRINQKASAAYDWIRSNIHELPEDKTFDIQVAATIIANAIKEFNSPDLDIAFQSEYGEATFDMDNLDTVAKTVSKKICESNPLLVKEILLRSQTHNEYEKRKIQYNSRVSMVAYAQYLANALSLVYKKYCQDPDSYLYIGYDLGIDLSSPAKILGQQRGDEWIGGVTEEQVNVIISSLEEIIDNTGPLRKPKSQTLHYGYRIDRAWEELESYLIRAKKQASSARATELARDYIVSRMSFVSGQQIGEIRERISGVFPSRSLLFNGTADQPETGSSLVTKRRMPFISKQFAMTALPGTQMIGEWLLRNNKTKVLKAFSSEVDAKKYLSTLPDKDSPDWKIEPDPYWVNEQYGFDSSKMQIGINTPKVVGPPSDFQWPPVPWSMEVAGINLPFDITDTKQDASVNKAGLIPILNYRFVIDFDGEPIDISFLFRKGVNKNDRDQIEKAEKHIITATEASKQNIITFRQENAAKIAENPKIFADYAALEEDRLAKEIEPMMQIINAKPPFVTTYASYVDPTDPKIRRPMLRLSLEDPMRAYNLIMHPETRGVTLTPADQRLLINFIIRVYNLDMIRDIARKVGGAYEHLQTIDLFEKADVLNFKFLAGRLKLDTTEDDQPAWKHLPGEYFNLVPGEDGTDRGSYFQYVYNTNQNVTSTLAAGKHPNIKTLITASESAKKQGLSEVESDNNVFINRMETDMLQYIRSRTSGERQNEAKDRRRKRAAEESKKKTLREYKLDRILLSLGLPFDDVEIPAF